VDAEMKITKWESQVRKGVFDFAILLCIEHEVCYGYQLMARIKEIAKIDVAEGTIYPLLSRLSKEGLVTSKWVQMETGMPRKYYEITEQGKRTLVGMKRSWKQFCASVNRLQEQS
jgi:PadR family transcriptional regulator PadR